MAVTRTVRWLLMAAAPGLALAQEPVATVEADPAAPPGDAQSAPDATQSRNRLVGEIIVTAQKREESIQDVPISIAAFTGETLDAKGVHTVNDLQQHTAGLQFGSYAGYPLIYLRGVGTDVFLPSEDPSVTTYIDGIYIPSSQGVIQSFGGIERVEVLKGPQGTLFGRNSVGGAISIVTRKPADHFEASVQAITGNFDEKRAKVYATGPITSWLGVNVDGIWSDVDHQYTHIEEDRGIAPEKSKAGHARVNFHPGESFDVDVGYLEVKNSGAGTQVVKNIKPSALLAGTVLQIEPQEDNRKIESDHIGGYKASHRLWTATATWRLPWFDAKLIGSDQVIKSYDSTLDFDASPKPIAVFGTEGDQFTDGYTGELQLVSNGGWGGESLEWVLGAYYLENVSGVDPGAFTGGAGALTFLGIPDAVIDLLNLPGDVNPNNGVKLLIAGTMATRSVSEYAQVTWKALDWLSLTLGGRYQWEERQLLKSQTEIVLTEDAAATLLQFPLEHASYTNFSPKAVISVRPREDAMVYLSWAQGFKSGTFNIVTLYSPGSYVDPEETETFDLGMKVDFLDRALRVNAALFHSDIKDLHASFVSLAHGGAIAFQNAGKARIYGAEFDATWVAFPRANPGFVVTANGAYLHSRYTSFPDGDGFDPDTGLYTPNQDFSDNTIVRSPKWTGGLGLSQVVPASWDGEFEFGLDTYYNSGFYYDPQNSVKEDGYSLVNARLSYLHRPWNLRMTVFGKNLTNSTYHLSIFQCDFGDLSTRAYPVQYGVQLNWDL
ncbi:MAG TPA: TonB-dependent receptor [Nevskiaceae bacterium]|nr:TonB-dependent receptor [Nevskiaceae bacterium]